MIFRGICIACRTFTWEMPKVAYIGWFRKGPECGFKHVKYFVKETGSVLTFIDDSIQSVQCLSGSALHIYDKHLSNPKTESAFGHLRKRV